MVELNAPLPTPAASAEAKWSQPRESPPSSLDGEGGRRKSPPKDSLVAGLDRVNKFWGGIVRLEMKKKLELNFNNNYYCIGRPDYVTPERKDTTDDDEPKFQAGSP